jgi:exoribonuclease R
MNEIARNRRKWRLENGSLTFDKLKKRFQMDDKSYPISYSLEEVL